MNSTPQFPASFLLLQQEGYLIHSCLTVGLTDLRHANVHNKGGFYSGLLNLSIGIERLLKAVVIIDHMLNNNLSAPTRNQLKSYGHNIICLYSTVESVAVKRNINLPNLSSLDAINQNLLRLLSDFAQTTRYHNLDSLSTNQTGKDPLSHWGEIILAILEQDVTEKQRIKILHQAGVISNLIKDKTMVLMHGLDQQPLSLADSLALPGLHNHAVKHAALRLITILYPVKELISDLSNEAYNLGHSVPPFPQMQDFLDWLWNDKQYILRKKKWP